MYQDVDSAEEFHGEAENMRKIYQSKTIWSDHHCINCSDEPLLKLTKPERRSTNICLSCQASRYQVSMSGSVASSADLCMTCMYIGTMAIGLLVIDRAHNHLLFVSAETEQGIPSIRVGLHRYNHLSLHD